MFQLYILYYSGPAVVGLLGSGRDVLVNIGCVSVLVSRHLSGFGMIVILGIVTDIWSYLCWVGFFFLGFCRPFWISRECGGCGLLGTECF